MKKYSLISILAFLIAAEVSCYSDAENYKEAYIIKSDSVTFIKVKGKRVPMHGPGTYEDSELIPIPKDTDGRIEGKDIPRPSGYFAYKGYIVIDKIKLSINLLIDDTADHKLREETWNGEYIIVR